ATPSGLRRVGPRCWWTPRPIASEAFSTPAWPRRVRLAPHTGRPSSRAACFCGASRLRKRGSGCCWGNHRAGRRWARARERGDGRGGGDDGQRAGGAEIQREVAQREVAEVPIESIERVLQLHRGQSSDPREVHEGPLRLEREQDARKHFRAAQLLGETLPPGL